MVCGIQLTDAHGRKTTMRLSEVCRLCLCSETMFLPLYNSAENLHEKIRTISSRVKVSAGDGLPAQICHQCARLVNTCFSFKMQVEKTDMLLRHYVSSHSEDDGCVECQEVKNYGNGGQQKLDCENYDDTVTMVPLQERNTAEDLGLTCKNTQCGIGPENCVTDREDNVLEGESKFAAVDYDMCFRNSKKPAEVDDAVSDGDNMVSSVSATNLTPEHQHKNGTRLFRKSKAKFCVPGSWGKEIRSLHSHNTYDVNTKNSDSKEGESHAKQVLHSSGNGNENTTVTGTGHSLVSHVHKVYYYEHSNRHIAEPSKYQQCAVCGKSVRKLNLHMKMHTGEKPYQCSICGQRFIQKGSLEKHNTLHTGERPYSCGLCGKTFRCKSDLNQHTKLHTGNAHMCSICGKFFTTRPNLDSHIRTHTGEKPYLCHTCGIHFTQKGALTKHSRIHANDRPHQCSVCNKRFITHSALNLHFRIHTGEKPYTCATCQKSFSDRGYFMRHLMIHSGEKGFVCSVCGKAFTQQIGLKRHVRVHTGEKPFHCYCGESFALKRDLKRHTERLHQVNK